MTYVQLRDKLANTCLFNDDEIAKIIINCGKATMGSAVIAAEIAGIELTGDDIDVMFDSLNN